MSACRVAVMGATGYGGAGVVSCILGHPEAELVWAGSGTFAGQPLSEACPWLRGRTELICQPQDVSEAAEADVVIMAQPNGFAMQHAAKALESGAKVVDLSGDFRIKDSEVYERYYGIPQKAPKLLAEAVYGLPEITGERVRGARLIANTGCYPSGPILALYPLLAKALIDNDGIIVDAISGVSGAGRAKHTLGLHFAEINESLSAYRIGNHQHTPEIEQALTEAAGQPVALTFTPHLAPVTRGILSTCYASVPSGRSADGAAAACREALLEAYADKPFIRVLPEDVTPSTKATVGSNHCDIGVFDDPRTRRVILVSAVDNLTRGAASQAVQNMNLTMGLTEAAGIDMLPVFP